MNKSKSSGDKSTPIVAVDVEGEVSKDNNRGGRPRGKDGQRRGEKGASRPSGGEESGRRPKREFERRSGTGR